MEESINSNNFEDKNSELILFDSSCSLEDLKSILRNQKIITFDMESHELLTKNNILHEISDTYATSLDDIQNLTYHFSKWYKEPNVVNSITYEGINLGKLFYVEFHYFLVSFVKKFSEVISIINTYANVTIFASPDLHNLVLCLKKDKINLMGKEQTTTFLYDSFKIKISNSITINISKNNYQKLKNMSEKFISFFFTPKTLNLGKSILLVEFDPIKYEKFFSLSKSRLQLTLLNRRRPSIWNIKSFSIVRKSRCGIVTHHNVLDNKLARHIEQQISSFKEKYSTLFTNNDGFFANFFAINNSSFWPALKPFLTNLAEKRMINAIFEIEITKKILEKYPFHAILVWSENGFNEQIVIGLAKMKKISVIMLQHGLYYDSPKALEFNQFAGILPINSDYILCWGNSMRKSLANWGFAREKIKVIGNPAYDDVFIKKITSEKNFVLLITSSPTRNIASDLTIETRTHYINSIIQICETLRGLNKKVVVKLHPFSEELDVTDIVKSVDPEIVVAQKIDIFNLLKLSEFVITIDISTAIIEAQILGTPVLSLSVKNYNLGDSEVFISNSVIRTNLENFDKTLNQFLSDVSVQSSQITTANEFLENYLSNQGTASQRLIEFLEGI